MAKIALKRICSNHFRLTRRKGRKTSRRISKIAQIPHGNVMSRLCMYVYVERHLICRFADTKNSILLALAFMGVIVFTINVVQVALLQRWMGIGWILGFPLAVFSTMLLSIYGYAFLNQAHVLRIWFSAKRK